MYEDDLEMGFDDERRIDPITGRKEKKTLKSVLNKKGKISQYELDEIFLEDEF